jgi:hypothetical protein
MFNIYDNINQNKRLLTQNLKDRHPRPKSLMKDCLIQSPFMTHRGMWRTYTNPNPHGGVPYMHIEYVPYIEYVLSFLQND